MTDGPGLFAALSGGDRAAPALVDSGGTAVAHGELSRWTDAWAPVLDGPRKLLVVCFAGRSLPTLRCWLAAVRFGHAVAMLDADASAAARDRFLAAHQPDVIAWCPTGSGGEAPSPPAGYRSVDDPPPGALVWRRVEQAPGELHPDLALVLSTSGSTGSPKAVRLSYRNVHANATAVAASLAVTAADRAATALPLHFGYGLSVVASHLVAGGSAAVLPERPTSRAFWRRFAATGCTGFPGVAPTFALLDRMRPDLERVPSLRVMTSSGSRLRDDVVLRFAEWLSGRGGRLHMMYGQTESTSRMTCLDPRELPERVGSVGTAIPGGELIIADPGALPDGRSGDIVYRGPNVMMGYAEDRADLAGGDDLAGELPTGDLGYLDDGFLYLTGRRKRITKVFGLRVSLDDVERLFESATTAAGTIAAVDGGDRVLLYTDGAVERGDRARLSVAAELGVPASLLVLRGIDALPRTPNGKLDYRALPAD